MKLKARVGAEEFGLTIRLDGPDVFAEVEGRRYEIQCRNLGPGEYLLLHDARVYPCQVSSNREQFVVSLRSGTYEVQVLDPKRLHSAQSASERDRGIVQIVAPMPGKVVRCLVEVGTQVEEGAGIIVVEAMKMQNEMKAPKAGTLVSLGAAPGATVNAGDVLAVIE
jgi:biotin carboxyl carrier protein